jgi:hypothetical protein
MESSEQPLKRRPGRPPKHPGVNQYTGVKAKNIDFVRQWLRKFLADETLNPKNLYPPNTMTAKLAPMKLKSALNMYYRTCLNACRLLLACENVHLTLENSKINARMVIDSRLQKLGEGLKDGTVRMPDLLRELGDTEDSDDD